MDSQANEVFIYLDCECSRELNNNEITQLQVSNATFN